MTLIELLDHLDAVGIRLLRHPDGHAIARGPQGALTGELVAQMQTFKAELAWLVWARPHGHTWAECDTCGAPVLTRRDDQPCRMTPKCEGRHVPPNRRAKP